MPRLRTKLKIDLPKMQTKRIKGLLSYKNIGELFWPERSWLRFEKRS